MRPINFAAACGLVARVERQRNPGAAVPDVRCAPIRATDFDLAFSFSLIRSDVNVRPINFAGGLWVARVEWQRNPGAAAPDVRCAPIRATDCCFRPRLRGKYHAFEGTPPAPSP